MSLSRPGRGTSKLAQRCAQFPVAEADLEEVLGLCVLDKEPREETLKLPPHPLRRPQIRCPPAECRPLLGRLPADGRPGRAGWPAPRQMAGSPAHRPVATADGGTVGAEPGLSSLAPLSQRPMSRVREVSKQIHRPFFLPISSIKQGPPKAGSPHWHRPTSRPLTLLNNASPLLPPSIALCSRPKPDPGLSHQQKARPAASVCTSFKGTELTANF